MADPTNEAMQKVAAAAATVRAIYGGIVSILMRKMDTGESFHPKKKITEKVRLRKSCDGPTKVIARRPSNRSVIVLRPPMPCCNDRRTFPPRYRKLGSVS